MSYTKFSATEYLIIEAIETLTKEGGYHQAYGFQIAKQIQTRTRSKYMMGYGTLYGALFRLEKSGILSSEWELLPTGQSRPRRRYYRIALYETLPGQNVAPKDSK